MEIKEFVQMKVDSTVVREYRKKVHGNGVSKTTRAGQNLMREDVYELETLDEKLGLEDYSQLESVDIEMILTAVQSYDSSLQKAERILEDSHSSGIAAEVKQIRRRVQNLSQNIEDNIANSGKDSDGAQDL